MQKFGRPISLPKVQTKKPPLLGVITVLILWLGIECLVKTFNRGEDEIINADEINKLIAEDAGKELIG
jgi:hypothetical protein